MDGTSGTATALPSRRVAGVDVARALALIGMLMVHFGPERGTSMIGRLYALPHGRASILFVLVAGVGISLLAARPEKAGDARLRLFCFALFLLPLGLTLEALDHHVAVILHHYAAFYLLGIFAIGLSNRMLVGLAAVCTLVGPLIFYFGFMSAPRVFDRGSAEIGDSILSISSALLFTGPYPLVVWSAPLLWGMWIGRQDLKSQSLRWSLIGIGLALALAAVAASEMLFGIFGDVSRGVDWRVLFTDAAHTEMPLWIVGAIGAAAFVLGAMLLLADRFPRLFSPLAALGQMSLSAYAAHILVLSFAEPLVKHDGVLGAITSVAIFSVLALLFAVWWHRQFGRGPVESLMHLTWRAAVALWPVPEPDTGETPQVAPAPARQEPHFERGGYAVRHSRQR
jgi:uncharacterized membrane protein